MDSIWFVAESENDLGTLQDVCKVDKANAVALIVGDEKAARACAPMAGTLRWIDTAGHAAEDYANAIAVELEDAKPALVLGIARPAVRAAFGMASVECGASLASNVIAATPGIETIKALRSVYNDFVEESTIEGAAYLLVNPLDVKQVRAEPDGASASIEKLDAAPMASIEVLGVEPAPVSAVEQAERVVAVGFGARKPEMFEQVKELAHSMGAELGATMNIIENTDLMPGERYIGISGLRIAPKLYVGIAVAGSNQHLVGLRNVGTAVVVNSDPKARFFEHADYGIVGEAEEVVPALIQALG